MESKTDSTELRGRLNGAQRHRLRKLLHMEYTPGELAEEVGFTRRQVYNVYIPLGCPYERDTRRHIWIVGTEFRNWYIETFAKRKIDEDEVYCVSCKKPVDLERPQERVKDGLVYLLAKCPECANTVSKIVTTRR